MLDFYYILLWDSSKFIMLELKYQSNLRCLPLIDWKVVQCYQGYTIGHDALLTETWFNVTTVHNGLSFWGVVRDHGLTTDPCKLARFYAPTMNVCFDTCACFRSLRSYYPAIGYSGWNCAVFSHVPRHTAVCQLGEPYMFNFQTTWSGRNLTLTKSGISHIVTSKHFLFLTVRTFPGCNGQVESAWVRLVSVQLGQMLLSVTFRMQEDMRCNPVIAGFINVSFWNASFYFVS